MTDLDPLIQAMTKTTPNESGPGKTTKEMAAELGVSQSMVRLRLHALVASGAKLRVHKIRRPSIDPNRTSIHTTYELVEE